MEVKLISHSQHAIDPALLDNIEINVMNMQDLVAFCARVSNPSNQTNTETSEKLIKYLVKHKHWSPLEMVSMCLEITTTRDIARQMLRHRSFSFQEFSQRYADPIKELEFETREARLQDPINRQNSIELDLVNDLDAREISKLWHMKQQDVIRAAKEAYTWAVTNGIAKEQARAVLPEGNTVSRLYMNGTLRSWVHYIELRSANGTQKEHADVAMACAKVVSTYFPLIKQFTGITNVDR